MKNLAKFLLFVLLISAGISLLYDYRLKHGGLKFLSGRTPEKYTFASEPAVNPKQVASLESLNEERRALVKSVIPAVVAVKTSKKIGIRREYGLPFEFFFGNPRGQFRRSPRDEQLVQRSLGSGVVVTKEGHIVTNNHVVDQVDEIEVQLSDGRTKKAQLIGADSQMDLAVLKIDNPGVKPLVLADSDTVQVGDFVLAIGNPFGLQETVTDGIISWKGEPNSTDFRGDLLQTNAAINPGNSGGPLINLRGEIVGINEQIVSSSGGSQGIGFAIPSNTVRTALESVLKHGRIIRGYLGILGRAPQSDQQSAPDNEGVVVDEVMSGSPAAQAQLQEGDVIRKFNGRDVKDITSLKKMVDHSELNKDVELEILRNGRPLKVTTQIKEQPLNYETARVLPRQSRPQPQSPPPSDEETVGGPLDSIHVEQLTPEKARQLDLPPNVQGVLVTEVDPDSGMAELQKGDVIEEINQQPVSSVSNYNKIAASLDSSQPQVLSVCRHRARSFLVLRPR
jgi:Do/DeqQ family serine protease